MARFLVLWRPNLLAPRLKDPSENLKFIEKSFAVMDDLMKKGEVEEFGFFPDANSGCIIKKGESTDVFRMLEMFYPDILGEVHEIIPWEKGKEIALALAKAKVEATKK
ncbi:hypothetical protein ES703_08155 [subsurface metagenome]